MSKYTDDFEGDLMVFNGQRFYCHWCGGHHIAGAEVDIQSFNANGDSVDTPKTPEELRWFRLDWKAGLDAV